MKLTRHGAGQLSVGDFLILKSVTTSGTRWKAVSRTETEVDPVWGLQVHRPIASASTLKELKVKLARLL